VERALNDRRQTQANIKAGTQANYSADVSIERLFTLGIWKPEVKQWVLSHSKSQRLTNDITLLLSGYVVTRQGLGTGALTSTLQRQVTARDWMSAAVELSNSPRVTFISGRKLSNKISAKAGMVAQEKGLGYMATVSRKFSTNHVVDLNLVLGPEESIECKSTSSYGRNVYEGEVKVSQGDIGMRVSHLNYVTKTRVVRSFIKLSTWGFEALTSLGRLSFPLNGTSLGFGLQYNHYGFGILTRYQTHGLTLKIPVILSRSVNPIAMAGGMVASALLDYLAARTLAFLNNMCSSEDDLQKRLRALQKRRENAAAQALLMEKVAQTKREKEPNENGLIILVARYGSKLWVSYDPQWYHKRNDAESLIEEENIDVTNQLQFFVKDSQLHLPPGTKSNYLGFYDVTQYSHAYFEDEPMHPPNWLSDPPTRSRDLNLYIRYQYKGQTYEITFDDNEEVKLPSQDAAYLGVDII